jgi:replicative DNA helicase
MPSPTNSVPKVSRNGIPPSNLEAEMSLLGGVLLAPDILDELGALESQHFYSDRNRWIWDAILHLNRQSYPIDAVSVATELTARKQYEEVSADDYFHKLLEKVPHAANSPYYAALIISAWKSRQAVYGCRSVLELADVGGDDEIAHKAESVLRDITERYNPQVDVSIRDVMGEAWLEIHSRIGRGEPIGTPTGFTDLDEKIVGLQDGELVIVAARPAIGKSAFAVCLTLNLAKRGIGSLLISLEMTKLEWSERMLCIESGVDGSKLKSGRGFDGLEMEMLLDSAGRLSELPLRIDDRANQRVAQIAATARRARRKQDIGFLVIDYLQLIHADPGSSNRNREQEVASITKSLKVLAKELGIPVLVLAQLNRNLENREDKRPRLADLRESGSIEQDADKVLFLHRPSEFDPTDRPGEVDVIVSKNRCGQSNVTVPMAWIAGSTQFRDLAHERQKTYEAASNAFPTRDWTR